MKFVFNFLIVYLMADNSGYNVAASLLVKRLKYNQPINAVYITRQDWENQGGE